MQSCETETSPPRRRWRGSAVKTFAVLSKPDRRLRTKIRIVRSKSRAKDDRLLVRAFPTALVVWLNGAILAVAAPMQLTLERAYDMALATDQNIRIAYWEVRQANLLPWRALTRLGPGAAASSSLTESRSRTRTTNENRSIAVSGADGTTTTGQLPRFTRSESDARSRRASFTFDQPLLDLTVFPAWREGKLAAQAARLDHQFTIRNTLFGVAQAFFEVLKQQRVVAVAKETLQLAGEQFDLADTRAEVGEVTRTDTLRARVATEAARRLLIEAENQLLFDRNTLANILNLDPALDFQLIEPAPYPTTLLPFDDLNARAQEQREDLRVARIAIDQQIQRRNAIIAEYGPRLSAEYNRSIAYSGGSSPDRRAEDWSAGLAVSIPFLTGGQREVDLLISDREIARIRVIREQVSKQVQQDVKQAWLDVRTLEGTLKALKVQVAAAEQSYVDLQNQYKAGAALSVDVLGSLAELNASRRDLAIQTYDYQVALRNLEQSSGVFEQRRVDRVKVP